jgi:hypothetical protein
MKKNVGIEVSEIGIDAKKHKDGCTDGYKIYIGTHEKKRRDRSQQNRDRRKKT